MKKQNILLFLLLFISQFDTTGVMLLISILYLLPVTVLRNEIYKFKELILLSSIPFIALVMTGMSITSSSETQLYYILRDCLYLFQAPVYCYLGYFIIRSNKYTLADFCKILILSITMLSFINILKIPFQISSMSNVGMYSRENFNFHNEFSILVILILYNIRFMKETLFNKKIDNVIIIISIISVVLSFSRTNYFILLIIFFVPYLFYLNASSKIMISMLLFVIVNIFAGQVFEIKVTNLDEVTFGEKIKHSLSEVVVRQMDDRNDISDNWRGYEAYMGVKQYLNGNSVQLLFGQGLGANVKTPYWVFEGEYLNVIPIFHNGFITILLKTGIVGLILIFWFLITLMNSKQPLKGFRLDHHLLCKVSLGYFFLVNTFVTHGVFTKQAPFLSLLLLGAICSTLNNRRYVI